MDKSEMKGFDDLARESRKILMDYCSVHDDCAFCVMHEQCHRERRIDKWTDEE